MSENKVCCKEKIGWTKFSENRLIEVEKRILNVLKTAFRTWFVKIPSPVGDEKNQEKIWTIALNEQSKNTPLVLLHGFAAGLCFWCLNFDTLAQHRPVYAIDLLGFGRSSRPNFSNDCLEAEQQMVESLEGWRKQMNLERFILLGHSFGGYLATSYTIRYPERVKHLILADPWGFMEPPTKLDVPVWLKMIGILLYPFTYLNPLATVRAAGPIGPWLIGKIRNDISEKYGAIIENKELFTEYIYQCNTQKPTGETAFQSMKTGFAWAKHPMVHRFDKLNKNIPVTVFYGEQSWIRRTPVEMLKEKRPESYLNVEIIRDAGHHVSADQPSLFNEAVNAVCKVSDQAPDGDLQVTTTDINELEDLEAEIDILYSDDDNSIPSMHIINKKM